MSYYFRYFPNWLYANYPVEQIPYDQYTHINYGTKRIEYIGSRYIRLIIFFTATTT